MGQNGEFNDNNCVEYKVGVEAHLSLPLFISLSVEMEQTVKKYKSV